MTAAVNPAQSAAAAAEKAAAVAAISGSAVAATAASRSQSSVRQGKAPGAPSASDLFGLMARYRHDPLGFVRVAFPWNSPGTSLAGRDGPNVFQTHILASVRDGLLRTNEAVQIAVASGHGVGKTALVAMLILWALSTRPDTRGVVTAQTETQLRSKSWPELGKWHRMSVCEPMFKYTRTSIYSADQAHENTWRVDLIPWSATNTEAFAGLHNLGKRILLVFDEASAIPDAVWETAEGALTDVDTEIVWTVFGNPTRAGDRFRQCFEGGKFAHRWLSMHVDSRTVPHTNQKLFERWIADYGEDSDFVRVRVLGQFPRIDADSFIPRDLATEATDRVIHASFVEPVVLGVDVGRFGDDPSVIFPRRGRDATTLPVQIFPSIDTMTLASAIAYQAQTYDARQIFVDEGGVGGGVVDRLLQMRAPVLGIDFSARPLGANLITTGVRYANRRAEVWGAMRDWLSGGSIPALEHAGVSLIDELAGPRYGLDPKERIQLERKREMRSRGAPSPNIADALALTFAYPLYEADGLSDLEKYMAVAPQKPYDPLDYDTLFRE